MEQTDLGLFIGRLHPLIVHLPIGFLMLAFLIELAALSPKFKLTVSDSVIRFSLLLSWLASLAAIGCGLLLADSGGYGGDTLFWHKWLGIGVASISFAYWAVKQFGIVISRGLQLASVTLILMLLGGTGHLGGSLTHGEGYLTAYAPVFIKKALGTNSKPMPLQSLPPPDSAVLFSDLVHPILEKKCLSCHNANDLIGGLDLTTIEGIVAGGDNGEIINTGKPLHSELFVRVTLPPSSRKFMPPSGEPLSFAEVKILQWWLESGASFDQSLLEESVPDDLQELLARDFAYDVRPKPFLESLIAAQLDSTTTRTLEATGFSLSTLSSRSNLLQVKTNKNFKPSPEALNTLLMAKEQITWLDLSSSGISNDHLQMIGQLTNLTRLRLHDNPLGDDGLKHLKGLEHLESINLYGTQISGEGLSLLTEIPSLIRIYIWKTNVTQEEAQKVSREHPRIQIDTGIDPAT